MFQENRSLRPPGWEAETYNTQKKDICESLCRGKREVWPRSQLRFWMLMELPGLRKRLEAGGEFGSSWTKFVRAKGYAFLSHHTFRG